MFKQRKDCIIFNNYVRKIFKKNITYLSGFQNAFKETNKQFGDGG